MSIILILAGLWSLIFGRISFSRRLVLRGKYARYFGLTLLALTIPISRLLLSLLSVVPVESLGELRSVERGVSLASNIVISLLVALPFFKWQMAVLDGRADPSWIPKLIWAIVLFSFLFALQSWFVLLTRWTGRGPDSFPAWVVNFSKATEEGESLGKGKTTEECIHKWSLNFKIHPDTELDASFGAKTEGFLVGCIKASRDLRGWCADARPVEELAEERCLRIPSSQPVQLDRCRADFVSARHICISESLAKPRPPTGATNLSPRDPK